MKLVAAAKLRRAQERILAARPYANKMAELLGNLVSAADGAEGSAHPLLEQRAGPRRLIVIITADRGLAGAFNSNVLRNSLAFVRASNATALTLVVVGRKARDFYRRRPYTVKRDMLGFWTASRTRTRARSPICSSPSTSRARWTRCICSTPSYDRWRCSGR